MKIRMFPLILGVNPSPLSNVPNNQDLKLNVMNNGTNCRPKGHSHTGVFGSCSV